MKWLLGLVALIYLNQKGVITINTSALQQAVAGLTKILPDSGTIVPMTTAPQNLAPQVSVPATVNPSGNYMPQPIYMPSTPGISTGYSM